MDTSTETLPAKIEFDAFYNFTRGMVLFCLLLLPFPILHIFYNICCKTKNKLRSDSFIDKEEPHFIQSKMVLSLSLFFYSAYVLLVSYDTIGKYVNLSFTLSFCRWEYMITGVIFITAKALLYNYFILRANDTFFGTAYAFSTCFIQSILPIELIVGFGFIFTVDYWLWVDGKYTLDDTPWNNGKICIVSVPSDTYNDIATMFMLGAFMEIILALITFWILFNKLIIIIQNTTPNIDEYTIKKKKTSSIIQTEEYDPRSIVMNLSLNTEDEKEPEVISSKTATEFMAARAVNFHSDTKKNNKLFFLLTKLLTLLIVQIIMILIASIYFWVTHYVWSGYVVDGIVDIYCLWLTFKFSERYYYNLFGGRWCTKYLFPWVKTFAIRFKYFCCDCCTDNYDDGVYEEMYHGNTDLWDPWCKCFWCLFCCTRCYKLKDDKNRIFRCSKLEIEKELATKLDDTDVWNNDRCRLIIPESMTITHDCDT